MGGRRESTIGRLLNRIEDHIEEWRKKDAALKADAEEQREKLWAEAIEREKALAETISEQEVGRASIEDATRRQRVVFVLHSGEMAEALKTFAEEKDRLVDVIPGRGTHADGLEGSWLVFECLE